MLLEQTQQHVFILQRHNGAKVGSFSESSKSLTDFLLKWLLPTFSEIDSDKPHRARFAASPM
jgi:hypothetical protein